MRACRTILGVALLSGTVLVAGAAPALAQQKPTAGAKAKPKTEAQKKDEAKKLFAEANAKFEAGDFGARQHQAAHDLFKQADELVPGAVPKFRMAESLDKKGDARAAVAAYEAFLASNPPADKNQERIDAANKRTAALKQTPASIKVTIEPPEAAAAVLSVDGAPQSGNPVKAAPGKRTIGAKLEGFEDASAEIEVAYAEQRELAITLTPKPAEAVAATTEPPPSTEPTTTEPAPEAGGSSKIPAIVTLSLAGAGAVVGTVFGVMALSSKSDFDATPTQELADDTERNALIADMAFGVAITFGITGAVLLLTGGEDSEAAAAARMVTPWVGPTGGGAVGTFHF